MEDIANDAQKFLIFPWKEKKILIQTLVNTLHKFACLPNLCFSWLRYSILFLHSVLYNSRVKWSCVFALSLSCPYGHCRFVASDQGVEKVCNSLKTSLHYTYGKSDRLSRKKKLLVWHH